MCKLNREGDSAARAAGRFLRTRRRQCVGAVVAVVALAAFACRSAEPTPDAGATPVAASDPMADDPAGSMATEDVERLRLRQRRAPSNRPPDPERRPAYDQPRIRP